jgi:Protein of unknown function (DUF5672)
MNGNEPTVRPLLKEVTLVAVTSVALDATVAALHASMREAEFTEVLLFSDQAPPLDADPRIEWREIAPITSRADYSRFMLRELAVHIRTSHALCVQWDGFVLNGQAWNPEFLEFDYIGAVWPQFVDRHNVGNGGFSLRSRRLLEASRSLPFDGSQAEDIVVARLCRNRLEGQGLKFAPEAMARQFSYERTSPSGDEFGFHGAFNLVRHLTPVEAVRLFRRLEPGMLARSERLEILRWALGRGQVGLALLMLARLPLFRRT